MYIDYSKLEQVLNFIFPNYKNKIHDFCYSKKINNNLKYINKNKQKVLVKLKEKFGRIPLRVLFYVYDESKWKSQSVYDLMQKDSRFEPVIIVSKINPPKDNSNIQTNEEVEKVFKYFSAKGMKVEYGFDIEKNEHIPLEKFNPDIIIYSHPWYIETSQGPVVCSKFALTYYIPYFLPNASSYIEYDLRFHQYIHKHYVLNDYIKSFYHEKQTKKSNNLIPVGHPQLDLLHFNEKNSNKNYVIYAPHWTVSGNNILYSTFEWNGEYILEYAKKHPEINWVFKPHPLLYKHILNTQFWTKEKLDKYYEDWKSIALYHDNSDYLSLFSESIAMITDCGSFLTEYLLTEKPLIHLVSERAVEYNEDVKKIVKSYYQANNIKELANFLINVIIENNDYKKHERLNVLEELSLKNNSCAKRIINDIEKDLR